MPDLVKITDSAKEQMVQMLKEHSTQAVRLAVKGGGCAGFKYDWTLDDSIESGDEIIDLPKGKFIIDGTSVMYLVGSTIDYKKEVFGSYFSITNPASTASCGCGESVGF
jgi:iron-sulfur cluster assembly protein